MNIQEYKRLQSAHEVMANKRIAIAERKYRIIRNIAIGIVAIKVIADLWGLYIILSWSI